MSYGSITIDVHRSRWIHRLIQFRYRIPSDFVLNAGSSPGDARKFESLAKELRSIVNILKSEGYNLETGRVDYTNLKASPHYEIYRECAQRLQAFDLTSLESREQQLAYWINLYNALVVDGVIQFGVRRSVTEVPGFFWRSAYAIGGLRFCAFDIEYGILRANGSHPTIPGPHFGANDPRAQYSLAHLDPRVHFALVCASRSCPPFATFDPGRIDQQLDQATRAFIGGGGVEIDADKGVLFLSRIFQWYAVDFGGLPFGLGGKQHLLNFIARYLERDEQRTFLLEGRPSVRFLPYDWSLNSV